MAPSHDILQIPPPLPGVHILYGPDPLQFGDLRLPEGSGPHPVAIVIHGGFWRATYNLEHIGHACAALTRAGIATWSLEYRRIGNLGGGWPGTIEDVTHGATHLKTLASQNNLDLNRVVAVGHSAGGHLALLLGAQQPLPLRGIVSLAGVADLRRAWELRLSNNIVADFLGGSPVEVSDRYRLASPIERLPLGIPQKLMHGTLDTSVPFEISERYAHAAKDRGDVAELIILEGAGHFEVIDPRTKEFAKVRETILSLIGESPDAS